MKKLLLKALTIVVIFCSCKKTENSEPVTIGNLLNDNAHILDTLAISSTTSTTISINKANTSYRPSIGDILLSRPFLNNPFGILAKVKSTTENSSQIICTTIQSNLNDAFKQLNINSNYIDTFSASGTFRTGSSLSVSFNANNTLANGIGLSGTIKFNIPSTKIEFVKRSGTLIPDKVLIQADFNIYESNLEIKNTSSSAINVVTEKTLITFNLPTIMIPITIGPVVIPIPLTQQLLIKILPISISGKAKWTIIPKISATLGVKYENSNWTNLSTYSIDASASPLLQGDFAPSLNVTATATIVKPVYEIRPFGQDALKVFFEIPNNVEFTLQPTAPNYSLKYKLDVTGGIKQSFWTGVEQEYSITGNIIEKKILEGSFGGAGTVTDIDGNVYTTVTIGSQVWMVENLKTTRYSNGDAIPNVIDGTQWSTLTTGAYCNYNNDVSNIGTYGRLYNWYAINDSRNIAPTGWHIPSDAEWTILINYLGGLSVAGGKMKEVGISHWGIQNIGAADNSSGFTCLPGGYRLGAGSFNHLGYYGVLWSSTDGIPDGAWNMVLASNLITVNRNYDLKQAGFSVRCIKN
jgi:uncharacterized protein (TIGR02145 family)